MTRSDDSWIRSRWFKLGHVPDFLTSYPVTSLKSNRLQNFNTKTRHNLLYDFLHATIRLYRLFRAFIFHQSKWCFCVSVVLAMIGSTELSIIKDNIHKTFWANFRFNPFIISIKSKLKQTHWIKEIKWFHLFDLLPTIILGNLF